MRSLFNNGWFLAFCCFICWAIANVSLRYVAMIDVNFIIFICQMMLFASATLLIISKPGALSTRTLTTPATWFFGVFSILDHMILLVLLFYMTATEAVFLSKINIFLGLLIAMIFKKRGFYSGMLIGLIPIFVGIYMIMDNGGYLEDAKIVFLVIAYALALSIQFFAVEIHETNNKTRNFADDARVTGLVVGITTICFLIITGTLTSIEALVGADFGDLTPTLEQFMNWKSLFVAVFLGVGIASATRYFEFTSVRRIKAEYFLALSVLSPIFTYGLESALGFKVMALNSSNAFAAALIVVGCFLYIVFGRKNSAILSVLSKKKKVSEKQRNLGRTRDLILQTYLHFDKDSERTSRALDIPIEKVTKYLSNQAEYSKTDFEKVKDRFNTVACRDPLTDLQNRRMFEAQRYKVEQNNVPYTLFYLDLNKFKPINDTYGHDIGDILLKKTADRLYREYSHQAEITRLGGDEFCVMFYKLNKKSVENTVENMKAIISHPFDIEGIPTLLAVTASIGYASSPEEGCGEALLNKADKRMLKDKGENAR